MHAHRHLKNHTYVFSTGMNKHIKHYTSSNVAHYVAYSVLYINICFLFLCYSPYLSHDTPSLPGSLSPSLSLSHTHTHTHTLTLPLFLMITRSLSHTLPLSLSPIASLYKCTLSLVLFASKQPVPYTV